MQSVSGLAGIRLRQPSSVRALVFEGLFRAIEWKTYGTVLNNQFDA
jgi:hypothetical protein